MQVAARRNGRIRRELGEAESRQHCRFATAARGPGPLESSGGREARTQSLAVRYGATQEKTLRESQGHQERLFLFVWLLFCF